MKDIIEMHRKVDAADQGISSKRALRFYEDSCDVREIADELKELAERLDDEYLMHLAEGVEMRADAYLESAKAEPPRNYVLDPVQMAEEHGCEVEFLHPQGGMWFSSNDTARWFPDEDSAYAFQRKWRSERGLHPLTGQRE